MRLKFTKMEGTGNDFVVINSLDNEFNLSAAQIKKFADRHYGIGFDQLLVVGRSDLPEADFSYRIFNADGTEVNQCGNGARCFVKFVHDKQLTKKTEITVETKSGIIKPKLEPNGLVIVNMGRPTFEPQHIPLAAEKKRASYAALVQDKEIRFGAVSMGNPHAIIIVDDIQSAPVSTLGPELEKNQLFPESTNVNFVDIVDKGHINVRVWERGVGETLACGSGACASVVYGISQGRIHNNCSVSMLGGDLTVTWDGGDVYLRGPARSVFEGELSFTEAP